MLAAAPVALRAPSAAADSSICFLISTRLLRVLSRNQVSKKTLGRRSIGDCVTAVAARLTTGVGGLAPHRAGLAPAGRHTRFHDLLLNPP